MKRQTLSIVAALAVWTLICTTTLAEVRMPVIFGDHMVLQRNIAIPVWGWADPGESVTVTLDGKSAKAMANDAGKWRVDLKAMDAGGPFELTVKGKASSVTFEDVLIGEVWLCTGQSNMDFRLDKAHNAEEALADTVKYPKVRLFKVERHVADKPEDDCEGKWRTNSPENAKDISAVGYFFGIKLNDELNVPIGLIHTAYGGTPAQAWTSTEALEAEPELRSILREKAEKQAAYDEAMEQWRMDAAEAKAAGNEPPKEPALPFSAYNRHKPTGLFDGMINPLIPYGIRGAIWYQGESNVWRSYQYRKLLPVMIEDWRSRWGQGDFPFGIVQLANYFDPRFPPAEWSWPELREAQLMTIQTVPNTGLVVTTDVGNPTDIHPTDKLTVGNRLAQWALGTAYGKDVVPMGPMYREAEFDGEKVIIHFDHAGSGLATSDGGPVRGLVITDESKSFRWATAEIDGDKLIVVSDRYKKPVSVRYGWADNPDWTNLINKEGLPASPFRTDDWPGITAPDGE